MVSGSDEDEGLDWIGLDSRPRRSCLIDQEKIDDETIGWDRSRRSKGSVRGGLSGARIVLPPVQHNINNKYYRNNNIYTREA